MAAKAALAAGWVVADWAEVLEGQGSAVEVQAAAAQVAAGLEAVGSAAEGWVVADWAAAVVAVV